MRVHERVILDLRELGIAGVPTLGRYTGGSPGAGCCRPAPPVMPIDHRARIR